MKQSKAFLDGEAEAWLTRNKEKITDQNDPVLEALEIYNIKPKDVLEVGCADGWRLKAIKNKYTCLVEGVDPGATPGWCGVVQQDQVQVWPGTADELFYQGPDEFDLVIYGFCLYLCDPEDYFRIAMEGDQVLRDGGHLIVYDFCTNHPYKTPYKHKKGLYSHHHDFSTLWSCHPAYKFKGRTVQDETCVTILRKDMKNAYPVEK